MKEVVPGLREWDAIGEFGVAVMAEISGEKANKMDKIIEQKKPRFLKLKSTKIWTKKRELKPETNKLENSPGNPKFLQDWRFPENQAFVGLKFLP